MSNLCPKELGGESCIHPIGHLVPDQHETPRGVKWSEPRTPPCKCGGFVAEAEGSYTCTCSHNWGLHGNGINHGPCRVGHAQAVDAVNHPPHYTSGGLEAIDVVEAFELGFNLGNVTKYVLRAGRKGGDEKMSEDLKKARWYLDREIGLVEQGLAKRGSNT